jgi:hypothetical protein
MLNGLSRNNVALFPADNDNPQDVRTMPNTIARDTLFRRASRAALTLLVCAAVPISLAAQTPARFPVTVALVDSLTAADGFFVVHRAQRVGERDVIVLDARRANGQQLASAVFQLLLAREVAAEGTATPRKLRSVNAFVPAAWRYTERLRAAHIVNRLRSAPTRTVTGLGTVRAINIQLPSGALSGRTSGRFTTK